MQRLTASANCVATSFASASVGASTMTRTSGSVPEGRNSTRPREPNCNSAAVTAA